MTSGEKIKKYRLIHKMTQKELAKSAGISESTLQKYELESRVPKLEQLKKLADVMGIPANALMDDGDLKSYYKMVSDILFDLFQIDSNSEIEIIGERNEDGKLKADTISLKFNNDYLNELLSDWELVKTMYKEKNIEYDNVEEKIKVANLGEMSIENIELLDDFVNFSEVKNYHDNIKMWLISRGDVSIDDTNNE